MIDKLSEEATSREEVFSFPLSFAQRRLWFLDRLEGGSAYNMPIPHRFRGKLDQHALEAAWNSLLARHETLRTTFGSKDGEPYQIVHPVSPAPLELVDLATHPDRENEMHRIVLEQALQPFRLEAERPWRLLLLRLAEDEHVLALTLHHIVCDGWSMSILFRELTALYTEFAGGPPANLPDLPIQYADFAVLQQEWMQGAVLAEQLSYWRSKLDRAPTACDLPTDRTRPAVLSGAGGHVVADLPRTLLEKLKLLSRQERVTLFMTLLAAFGILLTRYSRQYEVVIGTPVANRHRVELEGLVGFLTNTLPLRLGSQPDTTYRELLASVRETVLDAEAHQDLPFELLVDELKPSRDRSRNPLFQVMFSLYNAPDVGSIELPGLTIEGIRLERATAKFDLSLFMRETPESLRATFEYSEDLFDRATIARIADHLKLLLEAVVANPDQPVGDIALLSTAERRRLISEWNVSTAPIPTKRVDELIAERAVGAEDSIAVEAGEQSLTYGELDRRSWQLAHHLRALGAGPGSLVGLSTSRSADLLVALLGILKSGAGYVPLDPSYPAERLAFMLADSGASLVLTEVDLLDSLPATEATIVCLDRDRPQIDTMSQRPLAPAANMDGTAAVIYTSGSTGKPKGVETPHRALVNLLTAVRSDIGFGPEDTFLATTTLSFDIAATELFVPLLAGGRVLVAPAGAATDPSEIETLINRHSVTFMQATPSGWRLLLDGGWAGSPTMTALTAGEALTAELAKALLARVKSLWNYYGPTETTIYSTGKRLSRGDVITIGRPVANTQVYVLDERLNPAPAGVPGELYIGGAGLARGYLGRKELTAERFVANPFVESEGARMYKTGDLVRYLADGEIEYIGRLDHQVKVRGFRIEPGEIESALMRRPDIREAVVVTRNDAPDDRRLVAYIVPRNAPAPSPSELKTFLRTLLPEFMVPSAFVSLEALPLGPSRKIDRAALPAPERTEATDSSLMLPRNDVETALVTIWQELLATDTEIGINDDFFDLGGHSLSAVRLMALVEESFGVRLPLATLFEAATIEALAKRVIETRSDDARWQTLVPLQASGSKPPLFFLHGHDGELLYFRDLVRHLGPDQPSLGLQPVGLDGRSQPFTSAQEMAAHYADEVLAFQREGPHLLVGYCFSGVLAYEVALELDRRGHPPALVALIDALPRGRRPSRAALERRKLSAFLVADAHGKLVWIHRRLRGLLTKITTQTRYLLHDALSHSGALSRSERQRGATLLTMQDVIKRAVLDYVTPQSQLPVTILRAAGDDQVPPDAYGRWNAIAGRVEMQEIAADGVRHDNIVREPYAALLAERLAECAKRAVAGASSAAEV